MAVQSLVLASYFEEIEDPRMERCRLHELSDIILLSICAVVAGAEGWEDIEEFGRQRETWLRRFLKLPHGIPSHDTISRVFRQLKPGEFEAGFQAWTRALVERLGAGFQHIAVDGKSLRRSHNRRGMKAMLHTVCAWSVENHLVLGQQAVDDKSNEITAIPELLRLLELNGALVTIDAMGCQKEIATAIVQGGGDYVLAVKDNQPSLHAAIQEHFEAKHEAAGRMRHHVARERNRGRREQRDCYQTLIPEELAWIARQWPGARSLGQVISYSTRDGKETFEVRYYLSSLPLGAEQLAAAVRGHWSIENTLHWTLDMTFREDESRIRMDHGPENFALLRRLALSLLKQDKSPGSIRRKRKRAAWSEDALLNILTAAG